MNRFPRDFAVRIAFAEQHQDFTLALCEVSQHGRKALPRLRFLGRELRNHASRDAGRQQRIPRRHNSHGMHKLFWQRILQQEATRPRLQGVLDIVVDIKRGQHQDARHVRSGIV